MLSLPDRGSALYVVNFVFFRRKRKCPEKDVSKMGKFALGSGAFPNRRFIHRPQRWQNAYKTIGSSFWRTIGNSYT